MSICLSEKLTSHKFMLVWPSCAAGQTYFVKRGTISMVNQAEVLSKTPLFPPPLDSRAAIRRWNLRTPPFCMWGGEDFGGKI
jgi:hypothetical protein